MQQGHLLNLYTPVSYTHLRAHETKANLVCRLLLEKTQGNFISPLERISPEQSEIALEVFEEARQYAEIHGSKSLVIQHKGKIVFESYWQETEPDSLFGLHSFTKTMNALLVGHLIEDGFIGSIDDPVANYIEEWRNGDKTNITIKHLLHMSGGPS